MRKIATSLFPLIMLLLLVGLISSQQTTLRLKSGKQVKVLKVGPVYGKGMKKLAVELQYETELKISDFSELRSEVGLVWDAFRPKVEQANEKSAVISAVEKPPPGLVVKSKGYNFVFQRTLDGMAVSCR